MNMKSYRQWGVIRGHENGDSLLIAKLGRNVATASSPLDLWQWGHHVPVLIENAYASHLWPLIHVKHNRDLLLS